MKKSDRQHAFVREIFAWYAVHKRELPWRDLWSFPARDRAYRVLVSEIMLQQTQVSRVKIVFRNFLEQFPHIEDLARATNREILLAWRGMGYNSRALRLRDAARIIVKAEKGEKKEKAEKFDGRDRPVVDLRSCDFPSSMEELLAIPGIGHYTAAAIRNFAFNIPTPCLDTNIRRILHRTFVGPENASGSFSKDDSYLLKIAEELLKEVDSFNFQLLARRSSDEVGSIVNSQFRFAEWHSALMDFGALVQTKSNPKWDVCPLTQLGIMVTTKRSFEPRAMSFEYGSRLKAHDSKPREPGRFVGSRFIPNRIFRGRVVELLRDHPRGVPLDTIGKEVCIDWSKELEPWLKNLITKLVHDSLVKREGRKFALAE